MYTLTFGRGRQAGVLAAGLTPVAERTEGPPWRRGPSGGRGRGQARCGHHGGRHRGDVLPTAAIEQRDVSGFLYTWDGEDRLEPEVATEVGRRIMANLGAM